MRSSAQEEISLFGMWLPRKNGTVDDGPTSSTPHTLLEAIALRQSNGTPTNLRDLHKVIDVDQRVALRWATELEAEGCLKIDYAVHDRLASPVELTPRAIAKLIG